uniref:Uncharacterized protein n=1 Tax=Arundo donax TaxID=35708 RepID=A0A0A8Z7U2_ARUDO
MWALADPAWAADWNQERSVPLADVWADQSYLDTMLPQSIPALPLLHPTDPDKVYFFLSSFIFAVDLRLKKVVEFNDFAMPDPPSHRNRSSHFVHAWQYDPSSRPDFLPRCFKQDKFSVGPEHKKYIKKYIKRLTAAQSRMPPATHVTPVTHDNGKPSKRFRDHDNMEMEEQKATRMKFEAILSKAVESRKKSLPA